jgi:hypothetical protein
MPARTYAPVICTRCHEPRWPYHGTALADQFVCTRCRAALAGDPFTIDPLVTRTPAQRAADTAASARLEAHRASRNAQPAR